MMADCLFCKIANGEIQADIVYQDKRLVAFKDRNPQAPTHILVIPRKHIATLNDLSLEDDGLVLARRTIAKYREELRIPPSNQRKNLYSSPFAS